jgi:hypothetical protein
LFQKQLKISEPCVLEKKEKDKVENHFIIKDLYSIELSKISWLKEEISPTLMVLVERVFMELNSMMKTSKLNI